MRLIGVDVGGTFTDLVFADTEAGRSAVHKVSTTPDDPSRGVVAGLAALCDRHAIPRDTIDVVFHGTTIATNAILEHDGAVTGMITTGGYRDILHIGRRQFAGARPAEGRRHVLDGVISVETALEDYGVVVSAQGIVDTAATAKRREAASQTAPPASRL